MEHQDQKTKWTKIRDKLNPNYRYNEDWEEAIDLFRERVKNMFFNPAERLIMENECKGEGFTIVTIQCALIEMFAAFKEGKIYDQEKDDEIYYKSSKRLFTSFLKKESIFQDIFWASNGNNIDLYDADSFYTEVRCGLMHEARTKGKWHINVLSCNSSEQTETKFLNIEDDKIKIYRTVLHYRLLKYLEEYSEKLKEDTENGKKLRKHFARKLDHLYDFEVSHKYDWWT